MGFTLDLGEDYPGEGCDHALVCDDCGMRFQRRGEHDSPLYLSGGATLVELNAWAVNHLVTYHPDLEAADDHPQP